MTTTSTEATSARSTEVSPLLSVQDLKMHFPVKNTEGLFAQRQVVLAVDGVSFDLFNGETLGLVGESGCGKSSLGRTITRLYKPTSGQILFNGTDLATLSESRMRPFRRELQMVFQDPYSSLNPRQTVGSIIATPLQVHGLAKGHEEERVHDLLERVGLNPEHHNRYPHEFSGGQRQRIGIARALAVEPQVIVADEPVSALDVSIQAQVMNLLEDLQAEFGLTYLFIAHDLDIVRRVSDEVHVMYLGKVVEHGTDEDLYEHPHHPYSASLLSARPEPDPDRARARARIILEGDVPSPLNPPSGCRFHTRCPRAQPVCSEVQPELAGPTPGHQWACHYPVETWPLARPEDIRLPSSTVAAPEAGA